MVALTEYFNKLIDYCDFDIVNELDAEDDDLLAYEIVEKGNRDINYAISIGYANNTQYAVKVITEDYFIGMIAMNDDIALAAYFLKNAIFAFEKDQCFISFFKKFFFDRPNFTNRDSLADASYAFQLTVNLPLTFIDNDIEVKAKA